MAQFGSFSVQSRFSRSRQSAGRTFAQIAKTIAAWKRNPKFFNHSLKKKPKNVYPDPKLNCFILTKYLYTKGELGTLALMDEILSTGCTLYSHINPVSWIILCLLNIFKQKSNPPAFHLLWCMKFNNVLLLYIVDPYQSIQLSCLILTKYLLTEVKCLSFSQILWINFEYIQHNYQSSKLNCFFINYI